MLNNDLCNIEEASWVFNRARLKFVLNSFIIVIVLPILDGTAKTSTLFGNMTLVIFVLD